MNLQIVEKKLSRVIPGRIRRLVLRQFYRLHPRHDMARLGNDYGGWIIPASLLDASSICYCAGVGEDISFDLALIERFGCKVEAFDPTPEAKTYVTGLPDVPAALRLHEYGLWSNNETLRFYAPRDPGVDISHSVVNLQGTETYFEAPVKNLQTIMQELGHTRIDLLKMDIEGAEHVVLENMEAANIWPRVLCVEFDQPSSFFWIRDKLKMLQRHGYTVMATEKWNFTFVRETGAAS